mmetsp:Transcript_1030/g.2515  ORF Transcript_1030/g.2515 Transcript_1030/m.2515 type:complete len:151 (+) Transcript_1030:6550-7002(+)
MPRPVLRTSSPEPESPKAKQQVKLEQHDSPIEESGSSESSYSSESESEEKEANAIMAKIFERTKKSEMEAEDASLQVTKAEDDEEQEEEEKLYSDEETNQDCPDASDYLIASHEKVHRTKRRWRCTLQNCVLKIDGRDFVFQTATGDFEF